MALFSISSRAASTTTKASPFLQQQGGSSVSPPFYRPYFSACLTDLHIASHLESMYKSGTLTRESMRDEKLWLMHDVVGRMTTAILRDAVTQGTQSWEITIQRCLSLLLMAALCCRAGDFTRSNMYDGLEVLRWEHVTVHLEAAESPSRFMAMLELQYCKGEKWVLPPHRNYTSLLANTPLGTTRRSPRSHISRSCRNPSTMYYAPSKCS